MGAGRRMSRPPAPGPRPRGRPATAGLALGLVIIAAAARAAAAFVQPPCHGPAPPRRPVFLVAAAAAAAGGGAGEGREVDAGAGKAAPPPGTPVVMMAPPPPSSSSSPPSPPPRPPSIRESTLLWQGLGESDDDGGSLSEEEGGFVERVGFKDVEIRLPSAFTPLERIAVSAEGDLQRIISSYYNAAVTVDIRRCAEVEPGAFDREVGLSVHGRVFCTATSSLAARTPECARLLREQGLGLGQLFRHLKVHPDFTLLEVGKAPGQGFWRLYELDVPGVLNCRILERFAPDTFDLAPVGGPDGD